MPAEYTVTRAKNAGEKPNPHGGLLVKWYVDLEGPEGEVKDCYWQRKPGSEVSVGDKVFGTVSQGDYGPRFKMEKQDGGGFSGGGGSKRNDLPPEFWAAKDKRIGRAGMLQAVVSASQLPSYDDAEGLDEFVAYANRVTDALIASLDAVAPQPNEAAPAAPQTASAPSSQPQTDDRKGFTSEPQKDLFRRLLKQAGGSDATCGFITWYASEELSTSEISQSIDDLKEGDAKACAKQLALAANEWSIRTGSVQPDTADLPEVAA